MPAQYHDICGARNARPGFCRCGGKLGPPLTYSDPHGKFGIAGWAPNECSFRIRTALCPGKNCPHQGIVRVCISALDKVA